MIITVGEGSSVRGTWIMIIPTQDLYLYLQSGL